MSQCRHDARLLSLTFCGSTTPTAASGVLRTEVSRGGIVRLGARRVVVAASPSSSEMLDSARPKPSMEGEDPDLDGVPLVCDALIETTRVGEATAALALVGRPGVEGDRGDLAAPGDRGGTSLRLEGFEVVEGASPLIPLLRAGVEVPFRLAGVDTVLKEVEELAFDSAPGRGDAEYELSVESLRARTGTTCSLHCR